MEQREEEGRGRQESLGRTWGAHTLCARGTGAVEVHSIAGAGATSPTGLRLTGISSETLAALGAAPARITYTAEPAGGGS